VGGWGAKLWCRVMGGGGQADDFGGDDYLGGKRGKGKANFSLILKTGAQGGMGQKR